MAIPRNELDICFYKAHSTDVKMTDLIWCAPLFLKIATSLKINRNRRTEIEWISLKWFVVVCCEFFSWMCIYAKFASILGKSGISHRKRDSGTKKKGRQPVELKILAIFRSCDFITTFYCGVFLWFIAVSACD